MKPYILCNPPNECFALRSYLCIQTYFANDTPPAYHEFHPSYEISFRSFN